MKKRLTLNINGGIILTEVERGAPERGPRKGEKEMTKQMEMYMNGTSEAALANVKTYEKAEYRKAFEKGTDAGWRTYRKNVMKMVREFNKIYGLGLDADALMS